MIYPNETNEYGCPLCGQTGAVGVQNFDAIIARLAPDLRAAFEAERVVRQDELEHYRAESMTNRQFELSAEIAPLMYADLLRMRFEELLLKLGQPWLRELINALLPRIAAQQ